MVAGRQVGDERGHQPGLRVHGHDARTVVLPSGMSCLIRVGDKQPTAVQSVIEPEIHRWSGCLQAAMGCRLGQRTGDQLAMLVEHQNVRRKGILRVEFTRPERALFVAPAGQAMARFQDIDFEATARSG